VASSSTVISGVLSLIGAGSLLGRENVSCGYPGGYV
jgi:hypothetical protein